MKIQYISDIHTEFMSVELQMPSVVQSIREGVPDAHILVIAGDLGSYISFKKIHKFLSMITPLYETVLYVLGNHEYYAPLNRTEPVTLAKLKADYRGLENDFKNLFILDDSDILIQGKVFVGTTLWFDTQNPFAITQQGYLNDYRYIPGQATTLESLADKSYAYVEMLASFADTAPSKIDVLITHHGVSPQVHEKFRGNQNNIFYYRDITRMIERMDIGRIIHGHQHNNHSYDLPVNVHNVEGQRVTVSTNCKGYPDEYPDGFDYARFIEI